MKFQRDGCLWKTYLTLNFSLIYKKTRFIINTLAIWSDKLGESWNKSKIKKNQRKGILMIAVSIKKGIQIKNPSYNGPLGSSSILFNFRYHSKFHIHVHVYIFQLYISCQTDWVKYLLPQSIHVYSFRHSYLSIITKESIKKAIDHYRGIPIHQK